MYIYVLGIYLKNRRTYKDYYRYVQYICVFAGAQYPYCPIIAYIQLSKFIYYFIQPTTQSTSRKAIHYHYIIFKIVNSGRFQHIKI